MTSIVLRYDLRAPGLGGVAARDLYAAALEQAAWADGQPIDAVVVSEHHAADDGYLPSPLLVASAFAGRTRRIAISIAALLLPLYDPIRLAEDMAVLDLASGGRVSYVVGLGYRPEEYEALGRDWTRRAALMEEGLTTLQRAWTGEPFEHQGRMVRVRPVPATQPGPLVMYGGGSRAAARRAARLDLTFFPQSGDPALEAEYQATREQLGLPPGLVFLPSGPTSVFVADDPDRTWAAIGEHLLHDARVYAEWQQRAGLTSLALETATSVDELRRSSVYRVLTPGECVDLAREHGNLALHPLCGGLPPDLAWESLELLASAVIPALAERSQP